MMAPPSSRRREAPFVISSLPPHESRSGGGCCGYAMLRDTRIVFGGNSAQRSAVLLHARAESTQLCRLKCHKQHLCINRCAIRSRRHRAPPPPPPNRDAHTYISFPFAASQGCDHLDTRVATRPSSPVFRGCNVWRDSRAGKRARQLGRVARNNRRLEFRHRRAVGLAQLNRARLQLERIVRTPSLMDVIRITFLARFVFISSASDVVHRDATAMKHLRFGQPSLGGVPCEAVAVTVGGDGWRWRLAVGECECNASHRSAPRFVCSVNRCVASVARATCSLTDRAKTSASSLAFSSTAFLFSISSRNAASVARFAFIASYRASSSARNACFSSSAREGSTLRKLSRNA